MRTPSSKPSSEFVLKDWMSSHGFSAHLSAFESNGIGYKELLMLKEEDLKELGVERLGERKQIMQQIGVLKRDSIVDKAQHVGVSLVKLVGGSYVIALLTALVTSLQFNFLFYENSLKRKISLDAGLTMAAGLLVSFLLAPIIFQIMKTKGKNELGKARLYAAIAGGLVALLYLYHNADIRGSYIRGVVSIGIWVFPLYGFFQWVLYRAHVLATNKLIALTGAVALVLSWPRIAGGEVGEFIIPFLIGLAGFGLSFYFARRFRLYA